MDPAANVHKSETFPKIAAMAESYPDVFAPFGGFADGCPVEDSLVRMPEIPGIGFEGKANLWAVMKPMMEAA